MKRFGLRLHADEEHWIPLSDMMTGLMFLFLLIALAYMAAVENQQSKPKNVLEAYDRTRADLYRALHDEFNGDLPGWGATLDKNTLSIRFYARNVLFAAGSSQLQPRFKTILDNFFPRYTRILDQPKYRDIVSEVRIEGYTSSLWRPGASVDASYVGNMALSQDRTRAVLSYALALPAVAPEKPWLMSVLTANGLSFSHLIRRADGTEDPQASQRVEFRVRTNAEEQVRKLLALVPATAPPAVATPVPAELAPPVVDEPMPAYPQWAASDVGKPLAARYPHRSAACVGYLDGVMIEYAGTRRGRKLFGWGFETQAMAPIARVLFTDRRGTIVGAGDGGFERPDVPAAQREIQSTATGWQGYAGTSSAVTAWGVTSRPGTVCRFVPARAPDAAR